MHHHCTPGVWGLWGFQILISHPHVFSISQIKLEILFDIIIFTGLFWKVLILFSCYDFGNERKTNETRWNNRHVGHKVMFSQSWNGQEKIEKNSESIWTKSGKLRRSKHRNIFQNTNPIILPQKLSFQKSISSPWSSSVQSFFFRNLELKTSPIAYKIWFYLMGLWSAILSKMNFSMGFYHLGIKMFW